MHKHADVLLLALAAVAIAPSLSAQTTNLPLLTFASALDVGLDGVALGGICIIRPDGTGFRRLTSFETIGLIWEPHGVDLPDDHPDISPDGRQIVFCSNRDGFQEWELYLMTINGSNVTRLTSSPGLDIEPVFSPDGTKVAFASARFGQLDICVLDLATRAVTRLTSDPHDEVEPAWSPDGSKITFTRVQDRGEKDVFVMDKNGQNQRQLTFEPKEDHDAKWSPNGLRLAITSERAFSPPYGDVWTIDSANGGNAVNLTTDLAFGAGDPCWSPDGSLIAFFKSSAPIITSPQLLYVMDSDGGNKRLMPLAGLLNIHPNFGRAIDSDLDGRPDYLENTNRAYRGHDFLGEQAGAHFGTAIAFADLTQDGYPDLAIGAPDQDVGVFAGAGVVFLGRGTQFGLDLGLLGASGVSLGNRRVSALTLGGFATPGGKFGATLATGDFNGDGHADLAIGAPGQDQVFVMFGPLGPFVPLSGTGGFGSALAVGDFNRDGKSDLAVGAPGALRRTAGGTMVPAGSVTVFYGAAGGFAAPVTLGQNQLPDPSQVGGPEAGDAFGAALAAGDVNGDGADDLVIGAPGENIGSFASAGIVHIVPGALGLGLQTQLAVARDERALPSPFDKLVANARFGEVLALGDFNHDIFGIKDVVVGVPRQKVGGDAEAGIVGVFAGTLGNAALLGPATVFTAADLGGQSQPSARFGQTLAVGDFNDDANADLAIAAPRETVLDQTNTSQASAGRVYLVHGQHATNVSCSVCGPIVSFAGGGLLAASAQTLVASQVGVPTLANAQLGGSPGSGGANCLAAADFDGDGQDDLAIGLPAMAAGSSAGAGQIALRYGVAVGTFRLTPESTTVPVDERATWRLVWTHPEQWRQMATVDVRLVTDEGAFLWLRIDPERSTARLFDADKNAFREERLLDRGGHLDNHHVKVELDQSRVFGSGPEGREVTLDLTLQFHKPSLGRTFRIEVSGADDAGHTQRYATAGKCQVVGKR